MRPCHRIEKAARHQGPARQPSASAERQKVYGEAKRQRILPTLDMLIEEATSYWYKERRARRGKEKSTREWIARRDLGRAQRHQMAPLVGIAPDLRAVLAPHVAFQFMDRRRLRSPHDVERDGLMRVAAKAFHFEIAEPGVDRVAQRGRWLRRTLKAKHALVPRLDGEPVGFLARFRRPLCRRPDRCAVNASRVIWCPCDERMRRAARDRQAATDCGGWRAAYRLWQIKQHGKKSRSTGR